MFTFILDYKSSLSIIQLPFLKMNQNFDFGNFADLLLKEVLHMIDRFL